MKSAEIRNSVLAAALCFAAIGCTMAGSYHSARTLEPGTSRIGLTFSVNEIHTSDTGGLKTITIPNLVPELTFHTGIAENMEFGGRLALSSLGLEGDFKYRFLHTDKLHLAIDPAVGYQALLFMKGVTLGLPIIATADVSKNFSLNGAFIGRYAHYSASDKSFNDAVSNIFGDAFLIGGAFGPDIRGEVFYIRPIVEFAHVMPAGGAIWKAWDRISIAVHLGWVIGREKRQLDRIEKKIDKIDTKLDKAAEEKKETEE